MEKRWIRGLLALILVIVVLTAANLAFQKINGAHRPQARPATTHCPELKPDTDKGNGLFIFI